MPATAKTQVGGSGRTGPNIWTMAAAPTSENDINNGIQVGDLAINTTPNPRTVHICVNNAAGAAVWRTITTA